MGFLGAVDNRGIYIDFQGHVHLVLASARIWWATIFKFELGTSMHDPKMSTASLDACNQLFQNVTQSCRFLDNKFITRNICVMYRSSLTR